MILTYVCFEPNSLSPRSFVDLITGQALGFTPTVLRSDQVGRDTELAFDERSRNALAAETQSAWARVEGPDGSLQLLEMGRWPLQVMILTTQDLPPRDFLDAASAYDGFTTWVVGDGEDMFWQSADQTNTYDVHGLNWEHLPTINDPIFDRPKIDTSANPGRGTPIPGMWLWAGAEVCFGPGAFKIFDRLKVLEVPCLQMVERHDSSVVVSFYQVGDDVPTIRAAQQALRSWLDYDGVEVKADRLAGLFRAKPSTNGPTQDEATDRAVAEADISGELESWSRLYAVTDMLEQVIARYAAAPAVRLLAATLVPIISDIKAGRITKPIGVDRYPSMIHLENETNFADYVDVVNAHSEFREQVTVGGVLTSEEATILEQMRLRRAQREGNRPIDG